MSLTEFIGALIIGFMLIAFYQDNFSRKARNRSRAQRYLLSHSEKYREDYESDNVIMMRDMEDIWLKSREKIF